MIKQIRDWWSSDGSYGRHGPWSRGQLAVVLVALVGLFGAAALGWIWALVTLWRHLRSYSPIP